MAIADSTRASREKPDKPYASFPLYPHASGKWAKKSAGRLFYFGRWDDPQGALRDYQQWLDDNRGNPAPTTRGKAAITIDELVNSFLAAQDARLAAKEIAPRTFHSMFRTAKLLINHFGRQRQVATIRPLDWSKLRAEIAGRLNPIGVGNEITRIKTVVHWGVNSDLIDQLRFGPDFRRPPKATIRRHVRDNPRSLFTADELRRLIKAADVHLTAMILLGLNCGFNNGDVADLRRIDVDLAAGWINAPRKKTAVDRKCPLWAETVAALKASAAKRPEPRTRAAADRFFVRVRGMAYDECTSDNAVTRTFTELCRKLKVDRPGESFYVLRHCFSTWAQEVGDNDAVSLIMGHEVDTIRTGYRHSFPVARLLEVSDHVRRQLYKSGRKRRTAR
jgi:integrase